MVKKLSIIFYSAFVLTILLSGRADAQVSFQDTIIVQRELPGGGFAKVDTVLEGNTYRFTGFTHPFQYLNGGQLSFPDSSLAENMTLNIQVTDFAVHLIMVWDKFTACGNYSIAGSVHVHTYIAC